MNFIQRAPWAAGTTVKPFKFTADSTSVPVGDIAAADLVILAVTSKTVAGTRVFTLGDGTNDTTASVETPSVRKMTRTGWPASTTANLSVASLTGEQTIEGIVVAGPIHSLPDGRTI